MHCNFREMGHIHCCLSFTLAHNADCFHSSFLEAALDDSERILPDTTPTDDVKIPETPRKSKMKRTINSLRVRVCRMKKGPITKRESKVQHIVSSLHQYLPQNTVDFVETQIKISQKSKQGYRWSFKDKMMALSIYYQSKKAYSLLKKLFVLPSKSTLQKTLQRTEIEPGFNTKLFDALKVKSQSMAPADRLCALVFDEMSIKEFLQYESSSDRIEGFEDFGEVGTSAFVANHALVFMVRGLYSKWKQPIGYFLTSGPVNKDKLNVLINLCLEKLEETGLLVKVIICDQGSNNRASFVKMGVSISKPYITFRGRKIFCMYDPPHLIKSIRNNFIQNGYIVDGKEVLWNYVLKFYEVDKSLKIRMAPKLSEKHVSLAPFSKMRVNLAVQVMSHSVAAGISTLVSLGHLPKEADQTAIFIDHFDKLFNVFNSKSLKSKQPMAHALSDKTSHVSFLRESLNFLEKTSIPSQKELPCLQGWKMSINALLALWEDLHSNHQFKFLLTNRLNQDCIENLFSIIRGKGGNRVNPTPQQFRSSFRHIVVEKLFIQSVNSNCKVDFDHILLDMSSLCTKSKSRCPEARATVSGAEKYSSAEISEIMKCSKLISVSTPPCNLTENITTYIAGYLLRKFPVDQCTTCSQDCMRENDKGTRFNFTEHKAYSEKVGLVFPSQSFAMLVDELEMSFNIVFPFVMHSGNILTELMCHVKDTYKLFGKCSVEECRRNLFKRVLLYMKLRIHHAIKTSGMTSGTSKGPKRNRKMLKLTHC